MAFDLIQIRMMLQGGKETAAEANAASTAIKGTGTAAATSGAAAQTSAKRWGRLRTTIAGFARTGGVIALGGLGVAMYKSVGAASDLEESITKSQQTFERSAPSMIEWARTADTAMGLSQNAALEGASSIGAMLTPMGVAEGKAAKMSKTLTQLAGDMASFNNQDPTEMLDRIRSGLSGEMEPLKRYGTVLSETRVAEFAYAQGIAKTGETLTEQQKIQARYGLLLKDTIKQQGDYRRTSGGLANTLRTLSAQLENIGAAVGKVATPAIASFFGWVSDLIDQVKNGQGFGGSLIEFFGDLKEAVAPLGPFITNVFAPMAGALIKGVIATVGAFAEVLGFVGKIAAPLKPLMAGIGTVISLVFGGVIAKGISAVTKFSKVLRFLATPFRLLFSLAGKVGSAISKLAKFLAGAFVTLVSAAWDKIKTAATSVVDWITDRFNSVVGFLRGLGSKIKSVFKDVWQGVKSTFRTVLRWIIEKIEMVTDKIEGAVDKVKDLTEDAGGGGSAMPGIGDRIRDIGGVFGGILGSRADGGPIHKTGPYLIGERGPEVLNLPRGAEVVPLDRGKNGETAGPLPGLLGGTVHVVLEVDGKAIAERVVSASEMAAART